MSLKHLYTHLTYTASFLSLLTPAQAISYYLLVLLTPSELQTRALRSKHRPSLWTLQRSDIVLPVRVSRGQQ
jgi:hypothetical protein